MFLLGVSDSRLDLRLVKCSDAMRMCFTDDVTTWGVAMCLAHLPLHPKATDDLRL